MPAPPSASIAANGPMSTSARGRKLVGQVKDEEAKAAFAKALERDAGLGKRIDDEWARGYDSRAWRKFLEGRAAEGLPDAEKAVALAPKGGSMLDTRAQIYLALNRVDEALVGFEAAIAAGFTSYAGTYYGRAQCHDKKGDAALAIADYRKAVELAKGASSPDSLIKTVLTEAPKRLAELGVLPTSPSDAR